MSRLSCIGYSQAVVLPSTTIVDDNRLITMLDSVDVPAGKVLLQLLMRNGTRRATDYRQTLLLVTLT